MDLQPALHIPEPLSITCRSLGGVHFGEKVSTYEGSYLIFHGDMLFVSSLGGVFTGGWELTTETDVWIVRFLRGFD